MPEPGSADMFCFIKFHHWMYMCEFLEKHKNGSFEIFEAHQIVEWFKNGVPSEKMTRPFNIIKKAISLPTEE